MVTLSEVKGQQRSLEVNSGQMGLTKYYELYQTWLCEPAMQA